MKRPSDDILISLIQSKAGNISDIARSFTPAVSRQTVYNWIDKSKKLKQALADVQEGAIDFAESQAMLLMRGVPEIKKNERTGRDEFAGWKVKPDADMVRFYLKTKGKKRGYVEKQEIDLNGRVCVVDFQEEK